MHVVLTARPEGAHNEEQSPAVLDSEMSHMARILFMFTWNGRAWRQVKRLFKQIYHVNHYYYIHVDVVGHYTLSFQYIQFHLHPPSSVDVLPKTEKNNLNKILFHCCH